MRINADLSQPAVIRAEQQQWIPSPAPGVERKMLYREGAEVARATSIVHYAPGSAFPAHEHTGGEEILVLDGVFQDEHGDYPAGCYFRNPPGTSHSPAAAGGCTIFVRLWQFREGDAVQIVRQPGEGEPAPEREGACSAQVLFDDGAERVSIEKWSEDAEIRVENRRGLELLVLSGALEIDGQACGAQSWLRLPVGRDLTARCGDVGATVWIKDAPLQHRDILRMPG